MSLSVVSFTEKGIDLSYRIAKVWNGEDVFVFTKCSTVEKKDTVKQIQFVEQSIGEWAREQMKEKNILLFIGACGIAVRAIAPCLTDKLHDSPVLVMDERGEYVIPILSGHVGAANEIALHLAISMGVKAVITTATDINGKFSVDLFAKKNGLYIVNKDGIVKVSSKVLAGKDISMSIELKHITDKIKMPEGIHLVPYPPEEFVDVVITTEEQAFDTLIHLKPKEYVIGMGCMRGKEAKKIEALIQKSLEEAGILKNQIFALASIDRKKDEEGLLAWSRKANIPFHTYTAEQLHKVEGSFQSSSFVKEQVGVDNVCERAALKACGSEGKLIYGKHAEDGMTIALAKREWRIVFDEE